MPWPRIPKELAVREAYQQHSDEDERDLTEAAGMPIEAKRTPNDAQTECHDHDRETDADKTYHYANSSEKTGPRAAPTQSHVTSICLTRHGGSSSRRRRSDQ
jgi:hypothetical protein